VNLSVEQRLICHRYGSSEVPCREDFKVGLSRQDWSTRKVVHGLRHPAEGDTTGWYFWLDKFSTADNFFQPIHVSHLGQYAPTVLRFLALAPGWRFLFDETTGHEDVWQDPTLLKI
jgi:hypothetical protein